MTNQVALGDAAQLLDTAAQWLSMRGGSDHGGFHVDRQLDENAFSYALGDRSIMLEEGCLTIDDTGPEEIPHLLEQEYRGQDSGFGLAIVKQLCGD